MTLHRLSRSRPAHLAAVLGGALVLQGCASGATAPARTYAPAPVRVATPPASEPVVEMAPIPNPTEPVHTEHTYRSRHERRARSEEERARAEAEEAAKAASHADPAVDHARAAHLRAQGLEQLDRGQIRRAVQLLQAASQLDPDNALIRHDLERALRISKAVESRR